MSATRCYYHPDKIAITTCERCHKPICLEDKRVYRQTHYYNNSVGNDSFHSRSSYVTTHDYCILCYASQKKSNVTASIIGGIVFIIFVFFALGSFASFSNQASQSVSTVNQNQNTVIYFSGQPSTVSIYTGANNTVSSIPNGSGMLTGMIFLMLLLIIGGIIYSKLQADDAVDEAMRFKSSLNKHGGQTSSRKVPLVNRSFYQSMQPLPRKKSYISDINCFECGSKIDLSDKYCPNCGSDTNDEISSIQAK